MLSGKRKKSVRWILKKRLLSIKLTETYKFEENIYNDAFGNKRPIVQWYKYIMEKSGNHEIDDVNVQE